MFFTSLCTGRQQIILVRSGMGQMKGLLHFLGKLGHIIQTEIQTDQMLDLSVDRNVRHDCRHAERYCVIDAPATWPALAADPANRLHLYGKTEARPGRKMGHVNRRI